MTYHRKNPYLATFKSRSRLTKEGSTKSTYHIVLQIDPKELSYRVGDSIGCLPTNCSLIVNKICNHFSSSETDEVFVKELKEKVNIFAGTKKLLSLLESHLPAGHQKQHLSRMLLDQTACQTYLQETPLLEILQTYPAKIPKDAFIQSLRSQLPRFYSIASSSLIHPDQIHLTVSELQFEVKGKTYHGTASKFLCSDLQTNDLVPIYIQQAAHFSLPKAEDSMIMIGPGTGIAPFRAFLQERSCQQATGGNWLFFGERHQAFDFYYQDYLEDLTQKNFLRLDTAFSRDRKEKTYVQHKLYEKKEDVFSWIEKGAYIYVCGDAKHMAKDVEQTFIKIIQEKKQVDEPSAKEYLKTLRKEKRYLSDVY